MLSEKQTNKQTSKQKTHKTWGCFCFLSLLHQLHANASVLLTSQCAGGHASAPQLPYSYCRMVPCHSPGFLCLFSTWPWSSEVINRSLAEEERSWRMLLKHEAAEDVEAGAHQSGSCQWQLGSWKILDLCFSKQSFQTEALCVHTHVWICGV